MKIFQVLKPGFFTTVQDLGRFGYLRYGIPICGAMDSFSFIAANLLVGNHSNDAGLEMTLIGPELQTLSETQIAITGGTISPRINERDVPMWQTLSVHEGDIVSFGRMQSGCRAYLSIIGSVDVPLVMRSRSTYARGGFGGTNGRQLKTGDAVEGFAAPPFRTEHSMPEELVPRFTGNFRAHVVLGPQANMFTEKGINTLLDSQYKVTSEADRMGYRLEGPAIEHKGKADIVSDALLPGAIQVPKNGKPIVIMRDAQTTGGYPKIAVAVTPDVCMLGQARPNDTVEFCEISVMKAYEKVHEYHKMLNRMAQMLSEHQAVGK